MTNAAAENKAGEPSQDFLGMSDEDFLKLNSPAPSQDKAAADNAGDPAEGRGENPGSSSSDDDNGEASKKEDEKDPAESKADGGGDDKGDGGVDPSAAVDPAPSGDSGSEDPKQDGPDAKPGDKSAEGDAGKNAGDPKKDDKGQDDKPDQAKPVNYEAFFNQVMTPFKANGRMITLKTPEEAIRLMQMGAGYGRKLQDLQPHLKTLRMLEKAELLDENKLSFLIDINNKNPDAIKKLIKDAGIDPLDLNIGDNVDYYPKNHAVSDKEMAFTEALNEVQAHPKGKETLQVINQTWDKQSKQLLWESPELLSVIQTQRDQGVYDQIVEEIDRQKLLGKISPSTPFLQAYKVAGDYLLATNGFKGKPASAGQDAQIQTQIGSTASQGQGQNQQTQVIATRTETPKAQVQNGDKAAAAAPAKSAPPRKPGTVINPLAMADDDFLKQFAGRL